MSKTLIIGATSAIAMVAAREFAARGHALFLLARDDARREAIANDLRQRGASAVHAAHLDVLDVERHGAAVEEALTALGGLDRVLIAHGSLPDQAACERSAAETLREIEINATSVISLLTHLANHFEAQRHGTIAVIGSVAGDRGRQSNYVYGTAKGAVSIFLQGLRNRLQRAGVDVVTIKPGFVDTPMTRAFDKGGPLWASPEAVGAGIVSAMDRGRAVVYLPFYWRLIMLVIRAIPEFVFRRLSL